MTVIRKCVPNLQHSVFSNFIINGNKEIVEIHILSYGILTAKTYTYNVIVCINYNRQIAIFTRIPGDYSFVK